MKIKTSGRALAVSLAVAFAPGCSAIVAAVDHQRPAIAAGAYQVHVLPDDGMAWLWSAIDEAREAVRVAVYELTDDEVTDRLIAAHRRGVDVWVLLDKAYQAGPQNEAAYGKLRAAGVAVKWAGAVLVHEKALVVDGRAHVGTGNLTRTWRKTRDVWVTTTDPEQVAAIAATFDSDEEKAPRLGQARAAAGLLWSPGAVDAVLTAIRSTKRELDVTSEEFADDRVLAQIAATASSGVPCRVLASSEPQWSAALLRLREAGCQTRTYAPGGLRAHEKAVLVDEGVILGSHNLSRTSLDKNRELSMRIDRAGAGPIVSAVAEAFEKDFAAGQSS